jgi:hypothetical protein
MTGINRGNHFVLTVAAASQNPLTEVVTIKIPASVNTPIFGGGRLINARLG